MARQSLKAAYKIFLAEIKQKVYQSQCDAMKKVNKALITLYWEIGKSIVEKQQMHNWGKSVVENLSGDLQKEFSGISGLSADNLWRMRKFYLNYKNNSKLAPLVQEIGWSHNVLIMEKCKDNLQKKFYINMVRKYGWTKNVLMHHIEGNSYEKYLLGQTNFDKALPSRYKHQAKLAVKDEYNFGFLEIGEQHNERELELTIMRNMRNFLAEMGGDFAFIGNQYKLNLDGEDFFIDILLYHRRLKSLVAIELKAGKFKPEYAGQMNFYLSILNDGVRTKDENPSIGIIVCKEKKRTTVEYALKEVNQPIGVTTYKVTNTLPGNYKKFLPSPDAIAKNLEEIFTDLTKEKK